MVKLWFSFLIHCWKDTKLVRESMKGSIKIVLVSVGKTSSNNEEY